MADDSRQVAYSIYREQGANGLYFITGARKELVETSQGAQKVCPARRQPMKAPEA
jgi:hypothetical protein